MQYIKGKRIYLRRFLLTDADALYQYLSDAETVWYEPYPPLTKSECIREVVKRSSDPSFWAICNVTDELIGHLYFGRGDYDCYELGYILHKNYRHCGYAAEACRLLLNEVFSRSNVRRVTAHCSVENEASWRLLESLGMRREAHMKQEIWFKRDQNGRPIWWDTYSYGMLRTEWKAHHAVFSDIDGTVLNRHHQVSLNTKNTVQKLTKGGTPFVLVSARSPSGVWSVSQQLGVKAPIICYSGALIYDEEKNSVFSCPLSQRETATLYHDIQQAFPSICANVYSYDDWYCERITDEAIKMEEQITGLKAKQMRSQAFDFVDVHKLLYIGKAQEIEQLECWVREHYPVLRCYRSKDTYLEILSADCSKSNAMRILCKQFATAPCFAVAFGDHYNDVDLLQNAGLGIAMQNAPVAVQQQADRLTLDCDQDGVATALKTIFSLPK